MPSITQIVDAIEQIYANRIDEHIERLAHHAQRGEVWDKAVKYLRQAGARAFARMANAEAANWWEQALAATEHLPDGKEKTNQFIDIRLELRGPLMHFGELAKADSIMVQAQALSEEARDRYRTALALAHQVHPRYLACELDKAVATGKSAMEIATDNDFVDVQVIASTFLGDCYLHTRQLG